MNGEKYIPPEARQTERVLEGREREEFIEELRVYVEGLELALLDPDLPDEDRVEFEEQLEGLKDSLEASQEGGEIKVTK